jgi:hypothetical protein
MELILWRHAEAEDGVPDGERALTKKGRKQAAAVAAWLKPHLPRQARILASPATRAQQTAAALELPFATTREISVGATAGRSCKPPAGRTQAAPCSSSAISRRSVESRRSSSPAGGGLVDQRRRLVVHPPRSLTATARSCCARCWVGPV